MPWSPGESRITITFLEHLNNFNFEGETTTDLISDCLSGFRVVEMCQTFQTSVRDLSEMYFTRLRRHNYVTPTSYLQLIQTFKAVLNSKREEVDTMKNRYITGLDKLSFAASQVTFHDTPPLFSKA